MDRRRLGPAAYRPSRRHLPHVRCIHRRCSGRLLHTDEAVGNLHSPRLSRHRRPRGIGDDRLLCHRNRQCLLTAILIPLQARDAVDDPDERIQVLTVISTLRLAAIGIAPTIGGVIGDAYGWRVLFLALAILAGVLCLGMFVLLPETLHAARVFQSSHLEPLLKEKDDTTYGPVLHRLWFDRDPDVAKARASICFVVFGLSGFYVFLSNVSPLLEDEFGISVVNTALLMGSGVLLEVSVNCLLSFCLFKYKGASWLAPLRIMKFSLRLACLSSIASFVIAFGPTFLRRSPLYFLLNLYLFSVAVAFGFSTANNLFIQPFGNDAGKASAILLIARTAAGTGLSQISSDITTSFGLSGYYASFALVVLGTQLAWLSLPSSSGKSEESIGRISSDNIDEELRSQLLPPDDATSSLAPTDTDDASSVR